MADRLYSCETAAQTREWIDTIIDFIQPYTVLMNAHVVNFFKDRLWEDVNKDWMDCLRMETVDNLLLIPSGVVQEHWPPSLKGFVQTISSLSFPRDQVDLQKIFPGLQMQSLDNILTQGMNIKKRHEVEILSAVVSFIAESVNGQTVIDVGAGQGYLAQVLSFQYQHSVVAIDASSHHGRVTDARGERIKKHYVAQMRKSGSVNASLNMPKTVTCKVSCIDMLKTLADSSTNKEGHKRFSEHGEEVDGGKPSLVLAGLHACGDLSVTMIKTFIDLDIVKAFVSIGCCYNLLSEDTNDCSERGFPVSDGVRSLGLSLGKCTRDLACQSTVSTGLQNVRWSFDHIEKLFKSAERWRELGEDAGLHNFELHAFRAVFQMILCKYYPEVISTRSPSIGRQGKALRRQQQRKVRESSLNQESSLESSLSRCQNRSCPSTDTNNIGVKKDGELGSKFDATRSCSKNSCLKKADAIGQFEKFTKAGLQRLDLVPLEDMDVVKIWKQNEPFMELIGPYWSVRAALGSVVETLILLDRLLLLQEQEWGSSFKVLMLPIFDPSLSPRNIAIIAMRTE